MKSPKHTHSTCGRTFRTANGLATHVICVPLTSTQPKSAPTQEQDDAKSLLAELTREIMGENGGKFVNANIRARKLVAAMS